MKLGACGSDAQWKTTGRPVICTSWATLRHIACGSTFRFRFRPRFNPGSVKTKRTALMTYADTVAEARNWGLAGAMPSGSPPAGPLPARCGEPSVTSRMARHCGFDFDRRRITRCPSFSGWRMFLEPIAQRSIHPRFANRRRWLETFPPHRRPIGS